MQVSVLFNNCQQNITKLSLLAGRTVFFLFLNKNTQFAYLTLCVYFGYFDLMVNGVIYEGAAFQNSIKEMFNLDTYVINAVLISMPNYIYLKVGQF